MATSSYKIKSGDKFNVFTGQSINLPAGTMIYGDYGIKKYYGTTNPAASTTTEPTKKNLFDTDYYNQERNQGLESIALKEQGWAEDAAVNQGWVNPNSIKTLDADTIGMYINALAYGGYTIGDIVNDIKRLELAKNGNTEAKNLTIIDPDMIREIYYSTPEGSKALTETAKIIPTFNLQGLLNPELLKYGVNNIPKELFEILTPLQDRDSEEFKNAVADIKLGYIDRANNSLQAETEQEKARADYNMKVFKEELEKSYGIKLSDDADKAWAQIEAIGENYSQRGILSSGFKSEAIDKELSATRKTNERLRDEKLTKEDAQKASYYRSSASEAEIAALTPEEREKYGLTPSADILSKYSIEEMRKLDPKASEEDLQAYRDSLIDASGNYRSALYKNYYSGLETNRTLRKSTAESMVLQNSLNEEKRAGEVWDNQDSFSRATKEQQRIMDEAAKTQGSKEQGTENPIQNYQTQPKTATESNPYNNNSYEEMQKKVDAANKASEAAANILKRPYTPGTVETYYPSYQQNNQINQIQPKQSIGGSIGTPDLRPKVEYKPKQTTQTKTVTPKKQYGSVYDFYIGTTGSYNKWNSTQRQGDATKAGITGYEGTADQNKKLLSYLNK